MVHDTPPKTIHDPLEVATSSLKTTDLLDDVMLQLLFQYQQPVRDA